MSKAFAHGMAVNSIRNRPAPQKRTVRNNKKNLKFKTDEERELGEHDCY